MDLRVGTITIVTEDVFTDEEAAAGRGYRWTNALHVATHPGVIRKFLLFSEGEPFDPEKLAETERNLRKLGFLKAASVTASDRYDGTVDVTVVTQDSWSTEPGISVGSKGGSSDWGVELKESNVFGTGREISILYDKNPDRSRQGLQLRDPAFIRRYWNAELLYMDNSDGVQSRFDLTRPFYSIETPWAVDVVADDLEQSEKIYAASREVQQFVRLHSRILTGYGLALRRSASSAHRVSFGLDLVRDEFRPNEETVDGGELPEPREFRYVFTGYHFLQNRWIKRQWVNRDIHIEDFNLGTDLTARVGISPSAFGPDEDSALLSASLARGMTIGSAAFALGKLSAESRFGARNRNGIIHGEGWVIRPLESRLPQTTIAHAKLDYGSDLDRDRQFFADGETGLRGYRLHAFEGDRVLIANLEHRVFLGRELWHVLSPGAAAFVDTGMAGSTASGWGGFKTDVGVGLRLGLSRAPRNLFRLDFAYALDPDPRGERGFIISFSSGQAF